MRPVSETFIPQLLTVEQKAYCLTVATDLLNYANANENFFKETVTA
jgi:hypothetical protein